MADAKIYYETDPVDDDIIIEKVLNNSSFNRTYKPSGRRFKRWRVPANAYDKDCEIEFEVEPAPPEDKRVVMYCSADFIPFYFVLIEEPKKIPLKYNPLAIDYGGCPPMFPVGSGSFENGSYGTSSLWRT